MNTFVGYIALDDNYQPVVIYDSRLEINGSFVPEERISVPVKFSQNVYPNQYVAGVFEQASNGKRHVKEFFTFVDNHQVIGSGLNAMPQLVN